MGPPPRRRLRSPIGVWVYVFEGLKRQKCGFARRSAIGCARINKNLLVSVTWLLSLRTPTYGVDGSIPFKSKAMAAPRLTAISSKLQ